MERIGPFSEKAIPAGVSEIYDDTGAKLTGKVPVKTINGESILGEGNIKVKGGGGGASVEDTTIIFDPDSVRVSGETIIFEEVS